MKTSLDSTGKIIAMTYVWNCFGLKSWNCMGRVIFCISAGMLFDKDNQWQTLGWKCSVVTCQMQCKKMLGSLDFLSLQHLKQCPAFSFNILCNRVILTHWTFYTVCQITTSNLIFLRWWNKMRISPSPSFKGLHISRWEKTLGLIQNLLEGPYFPPGLGKPWDCQE